MQRRTVLVCVPALATAGCLDAVTGSGPIEREATHARVPDATLESTGYRLQDERTETIEREVSAGGQTRDVVAKNAIAEYSRSVDLDRLDQEEDLAVFSTMATPAFEVAGQTMSPVEDWSNRKLATELQRQYGGLTVGEEVDERSVRTLDGTMSLSKFEGEAEAAGGRTVDVYLHVGKVRHEDDFVVVTGIYPQQLSGEGERVRTLVRNLEH